MSPLRTLNSKIMNRYISTMPVVYISIQSGHLNYFESITVACHAEKMYAFVSYMILPT